MSALRDHLRDYLSLRRALGFRLVEAEVYLKAFCAFMETRGEIIVTAQLALEWATAPANIRPTSWAGRLTTVRPFARYLKGFEPLTEVPGTRLLPFRPRRCKPYLYSQREIRQLMAAAKIMPSRQTLRPWTVRTLIGLLAVTGMRLGEALVLTREDVDLKAGVLTIRGSKFLKSRLVPLHPSTSRALADYAQRRDACLRERWGVRDPNFLLTGRGRKFQGSQVHKAFYAISRAVGLRGPGINRGPRLHDMRHRFATETLLRWSRSGLQIDREMPTLSTYLGHSNIADTYWYLSAHPQLMRHAALRLERRWGGQAMNAVPTLASILQRFFTERLMTQRQVSAHTMASYRDTFRLLLRFAQSYRHKRPSELDLVDLDAALISAFLTSLEERRHCTARTRNARLTAIRSFFHYAAFHEPALSADIQRVLAIPYKRQARPIIDFLSHFEIEALLKGPDRSTWVGRRDHALLVLALQTGLRLSELTSLGRTAIALGRGAHVRCEGKGRKERCTPLTRCTAALLKAWLKESSTQGTEILFPNRYGARLSSDSVQYLVKKYAHAAEAQCPSLKAKRVSPHVLRHSAAMELLSADVDSSVIALWLGHESVNTTQTYLHAHLALKEAALAKTTPPRVVPGRYRPADRLLQFLSAL